MRTVYLFLFNICLFSCAAISAQTTRHPNHIDSIQSAQEIEALLVKIKNSYFQYFKVNTGMTFPDSLNQKISDSLHVQPWTKADFDNNGLTDILVVGSIYNEFILLCVLDEGNNKYKFMFLTNHATGEYAFPVVKSENDTSAIEYVYFLQSADPYDDARSKTRAKATLVYKSGGFTEENKQPAIHSIEKISYSTTGCFGSCPVFNLEILADRSSSWHAERYNKINTEQVKGNFTAIIDVSKYNELTDMINYLDFENLKDNYSIPWSDNPSSTLTITYDNGKTKTIHDYGLQGTFGLSTLYKLLSNLRENQQWRQTVR